VRRPRIITEVSSFLTVVEEFGRLKSGDAFHLDRFEGLSLYLSEPRADLSEVQVPQIEGFRQ